MGSDNLALRTRHFAVQLTLLTLCGACADEAECDEGQMLSRGNCMPEQSTTPEPSDAAASGPEMTSVEPIACDNESTGDGGLGFGSPCHDDEAHSDCACPAPFCAIQPGSDEGICTQVGCVRQPDICPEDWSCLDLSVFDPNAPPICTE